MTLQNDLTSLDCRVVVRNQKGNAKQYFSNSSMHVQCAKFATVQSWSRARDPNLLESIYMMPITVDSQTLFEKQDAKQDLGHISACSANAPICTVIPESLNVSGKNSKM